MTRTKSQDRDCATRLILARDRIREAEKILDYLNAGLTSERGQEIAAWKKRVKETVWDVV
jgi:flagellin-specific chaperone FliS